MRIDSTSKGAAIVIAGMFLANLAFADKPPWAGGGGGGKGGGQGQQDWGYEQHGGQDYGRGGHEQHGGKGHKGGDSDEHGRQGWEAQPRPPQYAPTTPGYYPGRSYFDDRHKAMVHDYYAEQFRLGHCPPGLAKKHNGCMPPGQAKKWAMGSPLPPGVAVYDLPSAIAMQLGMPPAGYRYVRVANDILLMATGTRMIVDAITDLGRR